MQCITEKKKMKKKLEDILETINISEIQHNNDKFDNSIKGKSKKKKRKKRNERDLETENINEGPTNKKPKKHKDKEKGSKEISKSRALNKANITDEFLNKRTEFINLSIKTVGLEKEREKCGELKSKEDVQELLEKAMEDELLSDEQVSILEGLNVVVPWTIPQLHQIETSVGNKPTRKQFCKIKELDVPVKRGIYTKREDDTIKANFKDFCRTHNITEDPTLFLRFRHINCRSLSKINRVNFVRYLAHNLNDRLLASVYKRFQRLYYDCDRKGRFSRKEDKIIIDYIENTNSREPYKDLAKILGRTGKACRDRYGQLLKTQEEQKVLKWTCERINHFIEELLKISGCTSVKDLLKVPITREMWTKMSEKLNVSIEKLRRLWKFNIKPRISIKENMPVNKVKYEVFKLLCEKKYDDYRSINWNKIAKGFYGLTAERLNVIFKQLIRNHVPKTIRPNLKETLTYLTVIGLTAKKLRKTELKQIQTINYDDGIF